MSDGDKLKALEAEIKRLTAQLAQLQDRLDMTNRRISHAEIDIDALAGDLTEAGIELDSYNELTHGQEE